MFIFLGLFVLFIVVCCLLVICFFKCKKSLGLSANWVLFSPYIIINFLVLFVLLNYNYDLDDQFLDCTYAYFIDEWDFNEYAMFGDIEKVFSFFIFVQVFCLFFYYYIYYTLICLAHRRVPVEIPLAYSAYCVFILFMILLFFWLFCLRDIVWLYLWFWWDIRSMCFFIIIVFSYFYCIVILYRKEKWRGTVTVYTTERVTGKPYFNFIVLCHMTLLWGYMWLGVWWPMIPF